jgi:phage shock protein A
MALLERVSTLVRANLNDLIDKAEEPEKMIKQVILDMQNQLLQVKTQVAIAIADRAPAGEKSRKRTETKWRSGCARPSSRSTRKKTTWRGRRCSAWRAIAS